jgi:hypothetical protein
MPAGSYGAGSGGAGFDPLFVSDSTLGAPTRALRYDLATRRFVEDGAGGFVDIHPVDQKVALLLGTEQGSLPSVATMGQRYRARVNGIDPRLIPAVVLDETRVTLAALLTAQDIELLDVKTDAASFRGRVVIAVTYRNLRDPRRPVLTFRVQT